MQFAREVLDRTLSNFNSKFILPDLSLYLNKLYKCRQTSLLYIVSVLVIIVSSGLSFCSIYFFVTNINLEIQVLCN